MTAPAPSSMTRVASTQGSRMRAIWRGERRSSSAASDPAMRKMSSVASSPTMSTTSSAVIVPTRWWRSSTTGTATRSYLATTLDLLFVHPRRHADDVLVADRQYRGCRIGDQQAAQRHRADQVAMTVDDVELEGALVRDGVADVLDRILDSRVLAHGHEVRRHQPAGRMLGILEHLLDVLGVLFL